MSRKIALHINGRRFDVDVEDEFSEFLLKSIDEDFNIDGNNDAKVLLQAYVRKNYELYKQDKKIKEITKKLTNLE